MTDDALRQAIANCDRDPIHIPGAIQSFGCLIATDRRFSHVEAISANAGPVLGAPAADLLGRPVGAVFSSEEGHAIRNALGHDTITAQREVIGLRHADGVALQITAHRKGERAVIELAPKQNADDDGIGVIEQARGFLGPLAGGENIDRLLEQAVERLRAMTGYDRIKAYRFLPDGAGEVVAESKRVDAPSLLGLRYPASDIPPIARRLYAETPIRMIHDVTAADTPLLMVDGDATPVDLSLAVLRGKDPVHTQYLKNMGVQATMTVPIVIDGALWGLFAAHHFAAKTPDPSTLIAAELAGKLLSLRVQHMTQTRRHEQLRSASSLASRLIVADDSLLSVRDYWRRNHADIVALLPSDGLVIRVDGAVETFGDHPAAETCGMLFALADPNGAPVTAIDDLPHRLPGAAWGDTAGALILSLSRAPRMDLAFLRNRADRETLWAGAPNKDVVDGEDGPRLTPRASFALYRETMRGHSLEWTAQDIEIAEALRAALAQALKTQEELRSNRHRLGLLVRELNHRVRNILSLVQSLSQQSRDASTSLESYATALEQRIVALAGAHNLLTRSEMHGAELRDLTELELRPFDPDGDRVRVDGPAISLRPDAAPVVALLLHELASNAVKYGALSDAAGRVSVTWRLEDAGLGMSWRESGGPPVAPSERRGFGVSIIEHALPYELAGRATLRFAATGVEAEFWLPGETLIAAVGGPDGLRPDPIRESAPRATADPPPAAHQPPRRALVVEDNFIIAMQSKRLLLETFFTAADTAPTIAEALLLLDQESYDFCLLDVNLHGEISAAVARSLEQKGVPYFFATGYGSDGGDMVDAFSAPVLSKPLDPTSLDQALRHLFSGR